MVLTQEDIKKVMPHRDPMLLVDRVEDIVPGVSATGYWYVKPELDVLRGHFPGDPTLPGVYTMEAMGQVANVCIQYHTKYEGMTSLFLGVNSSRFYKKVRPGDTLVTKVTIVKVREDKDIITFNTKGYVNGELVAEAESACAIR